MTMKMSSKEEVFRNQRKAIYIARVCLNFACILSDSVGQREGAATGNVFSTLWSRSFPEIIIVNNPKI